MDHQPILAMGVMDKLQAKLMTASSRPQQQAAAPAPVMPVAPAQTGPRFDAAAFKQKLKIGKTRAKVQQDKAKNAAHKTRQAVVAELRANKNPTAYIKMEQYLRDTTQTESHDILEAYIELLIARVHLIESTPQFDDLPDDVKEAIASLVFASARTSNTELRDATSQLRSLYTPNIVDPLSSASGPYAHHVNNIFARRMDATPDELAVSEGLQQIAAEENIPWYAPPEASDLRKQNRNAPRGGPGGPPQASFMPTNVPGPTPHAGFGQPPAGPPSDYSDMPSLQPGSDYGSHGGPGDAPP